MVLTDISQNQLSLAIKSLLSKEITQLNETIEQYTSSNQELIKQLAGYVFSSGGKRIRPILTLLCAKLFEYDRDHSHIYLATAVEFIHTATLLHDDVVDESTLRRGNDTANTIWGSKASILVGDYLFSQAFKLMSRCQNHDTLAILSSAAVKIAEGEVNQLVNSSSLDLSFKQYLEIITGKTARLFAAACSVSASIADQDQKIVDALYNFGLNLGILFQIIDDQLDYFSTAKQLGKNPGDDFLEGKITLPVILSNQHHENKTFWQLMFNKAARNQQDFAQATELLKSQSISKQILEIINSYYSQAKSALHLLPESKAKDTLLDILEFTISRTY